MDKSGSRESPAAQETSREVRQLMEGGNVATSGSEITHSPTGEQNGLRDAQGKLTRRRGDAEEVPEV